MDAKIIFADYRTPVNLQEHMLRVAALASIILRHWSGPQIDRDSVITACMFHDIAKPMTFDISKQKAYGMPQDDIDKLAALQERLKRQYGDSEHEATVRICRDIGCPKEAVRIVDNLEWNYMDRLIAENDAAAMLAVYCDMRIGPKGILPLETRFGDLLARGYPSEMERLLPSARFAESRIRSMCAIDPSSIGDAELTEQIALLSAHPSVSGSRI